jgi:hypothetical protein
MTASPEKALWRCPACGERFTTRNQRHSCGRFDLDELFAGKAPHVRALYRKFVETVECCGPVTVIPQKSRVAFQVRMRFAALTPRKNCLRGHLVLAERRESPCFVRVESLSPRSHLHLFRLEAERDFTREFQKRVKEAYRVGEQRHLVRRAKGSSPPRFR